jgi:hypothetical protein
MTVRTAAEHVRIAGIYERAAGDKTLPPQARAAFAERASWFRMLAQIEAAKQMSAQVSAIRKNPDEVARTMPSTTGSTLAEESSGAAVKTVYPIGFLDMESRRDC